jgi:hypothetical protein
VVRIIVAASVIAAIIGAGAVAAGGCGGSFALPPGAESFVPYGSCGQEGWAIGTAMDCPSVHCPGGQYYVICNGTEWVACDCSVPQGLDPISFAFFDGAPPLGEEADGGEGDAECGCQQDSDVDGPSLDAPAPSDGPLFDVGDLGDCSGTVAKPIPASDCGLCSDDGAVVAYALCEGLFFSTCSCSLPPGYVLIGDGGPDDGPLDATKEAAGDAPREATTREGGG